MFLFSDIFIRKLLTIRRGRPTRYYKLACFLMLVLALYSAARHFNSISLFWLILALSRCFSLIFRPFSRAINHAEHRLIMACLLFLFSISLHFSSFLVVQHIKTGLSLFFGCLQNFWVFTDAGHATSRQKNAGSRSAKFRVLAYMKVERTVLS